MEGFYRKEIKYALSQVDFLRLRKTLENYMEYDTFSGINGYKVRSLYFDSIDDRDLYDKLDGTMEKRKVRLRIYSYDAPTANLEYKCKSGSDSIKRKLKITRAEAQMMINCDYDFCCSMRSFGQNFTHAFIDRRLFAENHRRIPPDRL